jgi:hypothetical protein
MRLTFRSTTKLTALIRACAIVAGLALAALLSGGCASNTSGDWAQTSPVITPTSSGDPTVSLGSIERGS